MLKLSDENAALVRGAVARAAAHPDLLDRVRSLYADVMAEIDARKPRCDISGRCCRFDEYGHRLFVTTVELAAFVRQQNAHPGRAVIGGTCPYQVDRLCTVHAIRPFGCRIFFCDATAADWQHDQYERFHLRLRELHHEMDVPYLYIEWLEALRAIGPSA